MAEEKSEPTTRVEIQEADQTLAALGESIVLQASLSPSEDRRILRKIDMCLLPLLAVSYMLQFLDKTAMSYTAILGLRTDLHLVGQQYSWAGSMFYFGYLAFSYPASLLMIKLPVGKFLAASVFVWAGILMATGACQNARGLLAARFFLGAAEAAIAPGFSIITAMWYKRSEQPLRHGAWFLGNVAAGLFGSVLAYAIGHIHTIQPWRAVFLIFGGCTLLWSLVLFVFLPDTPADAKFLSHEDRAKAVVRIHENMTGIKNNHWKRSQMVEALLDPKSLLLCLIQLSCNIPNGGISNFGSIVVEGLGFSLFNTLLVQMIAVPFQAFFVILATGGSSLLKNSRTYFMITNLVFAIVGTVMLRQIDRSHIWARFIGYCILPAFSANFPMVLTMSASNTGGFTKKTTLNAMIFVSYCTGNIIGPQLFFSSQAPTYTSGFEAMLTCFAAGVLFVALLRFYLIWENKKRDRAGAHTTLELDGHGVPETALNLLDKTDGEMKEFRYVY